ncbi:MAG: C40 family peptidase [Bacteroidales bacterium]
MKKIELKPLLVIFALIISMQISSSCRTKKRKSKPQPKPKTEIQKPVSVSKSSFPFVIESNNNKALYSEIEKWLGTPHKLGGCDIKGVDCSCFVLQVYKNVYGIDLSRRSMDMINNVSIVSKNKLQEGDILFFIIGAANRISHVGIYLKENYFAHASSSKGVMISNLDESYWAKSFYKAGRHKKVK